MSSTRSPSLRRISGTVLRRTFPRTRTTKFPPFWGSADRSGRGRPPARQAIASVRNRRRKKRLMASHQGGRLMRLSTESLARWAGMHPWRTLVVWVVALLVAGVLSAQFLGDALTTDTDFTNDPEAKRAAGLLEERLRGPNEGTEFVVVTAQSTVTEPQYRAYVAELQNEIAALGPNVVRHVGSYLTNDGLVSENARSTLLAVTLSAA